GAGPDAPACVAPEASLEPAIKPLLVGYMSANGLAPEDAEARLRKLPDTPTSADLQKAFQSNTGHPLPELPGWDTYERLLEVRHEYVHWAKAVSPEDAVAFVAAVDELSDYIVAMAEGADQGLARLGGNTAPSATSAKRAYRT